MNATVEFFFREETRWQEEVNALRQMVLQSGLYEELKWGQPCYTLNGANIVLIHRFKEYCALLFFQGALIKDSKKLLIRQTKNVQSARQMRFTSLSDVEKSGKAIVAYIRQAIGISRAGTKVARRKASDEPVPSELKKKLQADKALKAAFASLTPGRQRGYLLYFADAKQTKTREARVEKYIPHILKGKGLNDA